MGAAVNSTRVGSPVVRVGPPGSAGLGEAPAGRVFPVWPLPFPSAHPRGSTFHGRSGSVYWSVEPGSVIFARDGLGWERTATFQPPRPVSDARSLLAQGRDNAGLGEPWRRRSSPRPSRPRTAALYLLHLGLTGGWEQLPVPGAAKSPTLVPALAVLPSGPSARHLSRSCPASGLKITINIPPRPRQEGRLTCQSPILARIDILAAGSGSPNPCWSWTARISHSLGMPVGKSSPYLSWDSLTWP